jgi:hypothetical protein
VNVPKTVAPKELSVIKTEIASRKTAIIPTFNVRPAGFAILKAVNVFKSRDRDKKEIFVFPMITATRAPAFYATTRSYV